MNFSWEKKRRAEKETEEIQKESPYHFPEIAEMEPEMIKLVTSLKDKIEEGGYDLLISDDVGGRVPTRVLEKVLKSKDLKIDVSFVASGRYDEVDESAVATLFQKLADKNYKRVLVVSEFSYTGKTLEVLSSLLRGNGLKSFDIAVVRFQDTKVVKDLKKKLTDDHSIFYGGIGGIPLFDTRSQKISGVGKLKGAFDKISGAHPRKLESNNSNDRIADVKFRVEDTNFMAKKILEKVWGGEESLKK